MGLALPGNGTIPAERWVRRRRSGSTELNPDRIAAGATQAAHALKRCLEKTSGRSTSSPEQSLDNAFVLDMAMGGSTNTVLHTLALAHSAGIRSTWSGSTKSPRARRTSARWRPAGPKCTSRMCIAAGAFRPILKELTARPDAASEARRAHRHRATRGCVQPRPDADGDVIRRVENAFSQTGGLAVLFGNLAPKRRGGEGGRRGCRT